MSTNPPRSLGKYELRERLGRGGMAEVWKAFDPQLKRYVAIKYVQANLRADPAFATRFVREAQAVASLRHPNIVRIYDFQTSTLEDGDESMAYMVMDYVEGQTLADYIRNNASSHRLPSASEIVHLFTPLAAAIGYAHQHGIIHRDIKPANILLDKHNTTHNPMGEPILSDFGIVKMLGTSTGTLTSASVGTPLYISPEQAKGQPGSEQSDIYSLGVTLFEVSTGVPPFSADSPFVVMNQHISTPPPSPRSINPALPSALEAVILRCLAKEPAERFSSASSLSSALTDALKQSDKDTINGVPTFDTVAMVESPSSKPESDVTQIASASLVAKADSVNAPADSKDDLPTLLPTSQESNPVTPLPAVPGPVSASDSSPSLASERDKSGPYAPGTSETPPPLSVKPPKPQGQRRNLYVALIALLIIVLGGSALGGYLIFSARSHTSSTTPPTAPAIVGQGFFSSSGQSSGPNNLGINDTLQVRLSNIPNPSPGKSYYAWLLPDTIQSEAASIGLGPLTLTNGEATLPAPYVDPQHNNLLATFSRVLITEEVTTPAPQGYSLDKTTWRYYAEIPQTPASKDCSSPLNQLSDLCHVRHLLAADPEVHRVGLPSGLNYWFLNNVKEMQKWAREAVDHSVASDVRHKLINILFMLDGTVCVQQDVQKASSAPGTDNTPDDGTLHKIAAIPLLTCVLTPALPSYLTHIHNHLNGLVQAPGVLADQAKLATQISTGLNYINALLTQLHGDVQQLVAMDNTQLTQASGMSLRSAIDALATRILSGGNDPGTGQPEPGIVQLSDSMMQLANFAITKYTP
jgi:serine/threonine protein kinase